MKTEGESKPAASSPFAYDATRHVDIHKIVSEKMEPLVATTSADPLKQPRMRTAPVAGRTVFVDPTLGFPAALKALQRLVSQSKIKRIAREQKFHERPGMRRKRLKMARWRVRFKTGFQATTKRVREMKKQGW
jgi:ribosomal protein S21